MFSEELTPFNLSMSTPLVRFIIASAVFYRTTVSFWNVACLVKCEPVLIMEKQKTVVSTVAAVHRHLFFIHNLREWTRVSLLFCIVIVCKLWLQKASTYEHSPRMLFVELLPNSSN